MTGIPRMPGLSDLVRVLQQQSEALASLPRTMVDLNRSILSLIDVVASARDTLAASQRVSSRLERIVEEMEEPVLALKPGLERLAVILQDPAVETIPETLNRISQDVLPLVQGIRDTQSKVNNIATLAEETSTRLAGLPGVSSLLGRRGRSTNGAARAAAAAEADQAQAAAVQETSGVQQTGEVQQAAEQPSAMPSPADGSPDEAPPGQAPLSDRPAGS